MNARRPTRGPERTADARALGSTKNLRALCNNASDRPDPARRTIARLVTVNDYVIDAIIGLSVVYKALDNLGAYLRWFGVQPNTKLAALIFGLVHGTGLATKALDYGIAGGASGQPPGLQRLRRAGPAHGSGCYPQRRWLLEEIIEILPPGLYRQCRNNDAWLHSHGLPAHRPLCGRLNRQEVSRCSTQKTKPRGIAQLDAVHPLYRDRRGLGSDNPRYLGAACRIRQRPDRLMDDQSSRLDQMLGFFMGAAFAQDFTAAEAVKEWHDETSFTLAPGGSAEWKLVMEEGQTAECRVLVEVGRGNFDLHGHGGDNSVTFEKGLGSTRRRGRDRRRIQRRTRLVPTQPRQLGRYSDSLGPWRIRQVQGRRQKSKLPFFTKAPYLSPARSAPVELEPLATTALADHGHIPHLPATSGALLPEPV